MAAANIFNKFYLCLALFKQSFRELCAANKLFGFPKVENRLPLASQLHCCKRRQGFAPRRLNRNLILTRLFDYHCESNDVYYLNARAPISISNICDCNLLATWASENLERRFQRRQRRRRRNGMLLILFLDPFCSDGAF